MEVMGGNHPEMVATYSKRLNIGVLLNSTSSKRKQLTSQKVKLIKDRLIGLSIRDKSSRLVTLEPHPMPSGDNRHEGMPKSVSQDVRREMSQGVRIAFLDSGIDPSHQEFQGRKITFWDGTLQQEVSRGEMRDYGRHGTHIASVAAGTQIGRAPGAEIIMAAVLTQPANRLPGRVGSLQAIVEALIWLATDPATGLPRADIVNMSFGCADGDELAAFSEALTGLSDAGLDRLLFASAGNRYSGSLMVPAKLDVTVAVGAHTNPPDRLGRWEGSAPMSDNPPQPQLYAPGVEILGAEPGHDSQRYSAVDGTSQASAAAAGEAAYKLGLLKRAGDNSQLAAFKKGPELFLDDPTTRLVALPSVPVLQAP